MSSWVQHVTAHEPSATADRATRPIAAREALREPLPHFLHRTLGNRGALAGLQPKLTVNQPGDVYEQEARSRGSGSHVSNESTASGKEIVQELEAEAKQKFDKAAQIVRDKYENARKTK